MATPDHREPHQVVLLLHGLRQFGRWPQRLARLLARDGVRAVIYPYGRLGAVIFLIPGVRRLLIWRLRRFLRRRTDLWSAPRVDVVAHSFGSYLATETLLALAPEEGPSVHTLILSGSVLKQSFPWHRLAGDGARVKRVVNECGERDIWPTMAQLFVLGMGAAGRYGFALDGPLAARVRNRFFPDLGHNDFFSDDFMRERWLPLLDGEQEPPALPASRLQPRASRAIEPVSEPIKIAFWLLLAVGLATLWA